MKQRPIIALLTDFGTRDWYVAVMKAVILSRCPHAEIIDITHDIPPQNVAAAAFVLAEASRWFVPHTVFVGVVDPGVGTKRSMIAAEADGKFFVGPDNGLFSLSLQQAKKTKIIRLTQKRYWLRQISAPFQGRDVFAPIAAHLALKQNLSGLGVLQTRIVQLKQAPPKQIGKSLFGHIVYIDRFGNLVTDLPGKLLACATVHYKGREVSVVSSYALTHHDKLIALANSSGKIELALRDQSAAEVFHAKVGDSVKCVLPRNLSLSLIGELLQ